MVEEKVPEEKEENKKSDEEKMEGIKRKVFKHWESESLQIDRIPRKTLKIFRKFANEEFVGDYGFCFKSFFEEALEYRRLKEYFLENGENISKDVVILIRKRNDN